MTSGGPARKSSADELARIDAQVAALLALKADLLLKHTDRDRKVVELRAACSERGFAVTADGFVRETDAAALIGVAPFTLRNRRLTGAKPIPSRKAGRRPEYALPDLADELLSRRHAA